MIEILPAIVPQSFDDLAAHITRVRPFAHAVHLDAGDGHFVPNTTWMPQEGDRIPAINALLVEAHLMVSEPLSLGAAYAKAGASRVIAHIEAFPERFEIASAFEAWRTSGAQEVGLAIRIDTSLEEIEPYIPLSDTVLIMTIGAIGTQGNAFDERGIERVRKLHARFPSISIAVDGGINEENIQSLVEAGAHRICVGSALAGSDAEAVYKRLREVSEAV